MALNTSKAPFDDILARQVLAAAIDQDELAQIVTKGVYPGGVGQLRARLALLHLARRGRVPSTRSGEGEAARRSVPQEHGQSARLHLHGQRELDRREPGSGRPAAARLDRRRRCHIRQVDQAASITGVLTGGYQAGFFAMVVLARRWTRATCSSPPSRRRRASRSTTRASTTRRSPRPWTRPGPRGPSKQIDEYDIVQRRMAKNLDRIFLYHARTRSGLRQPGPRLHDRDLPRDRRARLRPLHHLALLHRPPGSSIDGQRRHGPRRGACVASLVVRSDPAFDLDYATRRCRR